MKIFIINIEKFEKYMVDKKEKSGSLKLRILIFFIDKSVSKEELKMKIKVFFLERYSFFDESSGKSKYFSLYISRDYKEKYKEYFFNRYYFSSYKYFYLYSGSSSGGSKYSVDGILFIVLRSFVGLSSDGIFFSFSFLRKKLYINDVFYNYYFKMSKSFKSLGSLFSFFFFVK